MSREELEDARETRRPTDTVPDNLRSEACETGECRRPVVSPVASRTADDLFGRARVSGDEIEISGVPRSDLPTVGAPGRDGRTPDGDRVGAPPRDGGPLDATQMRLELMQAAMKIIGDIFSKAWFGFGKESGGGAANPFMQIIQKLMTAAMGDAAPAPGGRPTPGGRPAPARDGRRR